MFDNNVFLEGSFKRLDEGFLLTSNITYYRGIPLSMVNEVGISVDQDAVPRDKVRCSVDQIDWFTLDEMMTVTSYKWEFGEPLYIKVGGYEMPDGEHEVELTISIRTAYIPFPIIGKKKRTVIY